MTRTARWGGESEIDADARDASELAWQGSRRGYRTVVVGGEFWHGAGDRNAAVSMLDDAADAIEHDLTSIPDTLKSWVDNSARPALAEWRRLSEAMLGSDAALLAVGWDELERWRDRLVALRELALELVE